MTFYYFQIETPDQNDYKWKILNKLNTTVNALTNLGLFIPREKYGKTSAQNAVLTVPSVLV